MRSSWMGIIAVATLTAPLLARPVAFSTEQVIEASLGGASSVNYADFNGDGHLDLVITGAGTRWYAGDGSGGFSAGVTIDATTAAQATALTDFDGDGDVDVAVATDAQLVLYINSGTGTFSFKQTLDTGGSIADVETADLNNDGRPDLISCRQIFGGGGVPQGVFWFENNGSSFAPRTLVGATNYTGEVTTADVDRDGDIDVLSADFNNDFITLHRNNGNETFTASVLTDGFDGIRDVEVADLDSDGLPDLVACSQNTPGRLGWLKNTGNGTFAAPVTIPISSERPTNVDSADLDLDGDLDLLVSVGNAVSGPGNFVCWFENGGAGNFSTERIVASNLSNSNFVGSADIDADGDVDMLYTANNAGRAGWSENLSQHRSFFYSPGTGGSLGSGSGPGRFATGDFDGDGTMETAELRNSEIKIYKFNFPGVTIGNVPGGAGATAIDAGDIDRDGDADILVAYPGDNSVKWLENDNPQSWSTGSWPSRFVRSITSPREVMLHDFDRDGYLDAMVGFRDELNGEVQWFRNDQNPAVAGASHWASQAAHGSQIAGINALNAADINRDGVDDMIVAAGGAGNIRMFSSENNQQFTIASGLGAVKAFDLADINGDGTMDIVAQTASDGIIRAYLTSGVGSTVSWTPVTVGNYLTVGVTGLACGDYDLDGDADVAASYSTGANVVYANTAGDGSQFSVSTILGSSSSFTTVHGAYLDRDGMLDLVMSGTDGMRFYQNGGGHAALETAATAPGNVASGVEEDFFKVTATHLGRSGDADVEFGSVVLQLRNGSNQPLTPAIAQALIDEINIYADTNLNGTWDAATDAKVATLSSPSPDGSGNVTLPLANGNGALQVAQGTAGKVIFVTMKSTQTAGSEPNNTVRLTHVTRSGTTMQDPRNDGTLLVQYVANTVTGGVPLPVSLSGFSVE